MQQAQTLHMQVLPFRYKTQRSTATAMCLANVNYRADDAATKSLKCVERGAHLTEVCVLSVSLDVALQRAGVLECFGALSARKLVLFVRLEVALHRRPFHESLATGRACLAIQHEMLRSVSMQEGLRDKRLATLYTIKAPALGNALDPFDRLGVSLTEVGLVEVVGVVFRLAN